MKTLINTLLILSSIVYSGKIFGQNKEKELFLTGTITSVSVSGFGPNSAQLLFTVLNEETGKQMAIMVISDYEPQVFSSMANFVTTAYFLKRKIKVGYYTIVGETSRAIEISTPTNKKQ